MIVPLIKIKDGTPGHLLSLALQGVVVVRLVLFRHPPFHDIPDWRRG
jgi:hypothetical protein